jgi:hypothetical protein
MAGARTADKVEFKAGYTKWGQKLTLTGERESSGETTWSLHKDPLNQRDEAETIRGLSADSIRKMAAAVEEWGR